jgi:hypothetical protein
MHVRVLAAPCIVEHEGKYEGYHAMLRRLKDDYGVA